MANRVLLGQAKTGLCKSTRQFYCFGASSYYKIFMFSTFYLLLNKIIRWRALIMKILCITHADFEGPGIIEDWARQRNYELTICKPYKNQNCLGRIEFDFLIIMGGPQSPIEIDKSPYLKDEISLIKQAVIDNKTIFGFCLGAQLIGEALGGVTQRSPHKEIGVYPITLTDEGMNDSLFADFPKSFPVTHWHNDMPGETADSVLLASSEGCPKQILRYGPLVYGFQCHLEITKEGIQELITACPKDLKEGQFIQNAEQLLQNDYHDINQYMIKILDRISLKKL
jgi:GMP synthase (glutamine-hydrolysing)